MVRNSYGAIMPPLFENKGNHYENDLFKEAICLIKCASKKRKIPCEFDDMQWVGSRRKRYIEGTALQHEIYDISEDGRHTLICARETEGTKYGVKTTSKAYFIVSAHGKNGTRVKTASKAKAAKAAKQAGANVYGHAIAVCLGKKKLKVPGALRRICYKIVEKTKSGYWSVYDGSAWDIDFSRYEKSSMNHEGGFYVYPTAEMAVTAWKDRQVFNNEWIDDGAQYAVLECVCKGRTYRHDNNKICISTVRPIAEYATL